MKPVLRVIDSGLRGARANLAMTAALAELHRVGDCGDTLRFQHFPPSAIIGRHQSLAREVWIQVCAASGIETARRMTGGGAIYMGPGLLGWELVVGRASLPGTIGDASAALCMGLAAGLSRLGVAAQFRPRNDVEVDGRKVSGTGGYFDGGTLVFQGTVLIDFDVADMADALVLPVDKLDRRGLVAMAQRVVSLRELLGAPPPLAEVEAAVAAGLADALGAAPCEGSLSQREEELAARLFADEFGREAFVAGDDGWRYAAAALGAPLRAEAQLAGGHLAAHIRVRGTAEPLIERIWLVGDVLVTPPRALLDLEAALVGVRLVEAVEAARRFLAEKCVDVLATTHDEIVNVIASAAANWIEGGAP